MRYLLVGLGNIGKKRKQILGDACVACVDPIVPEADFKRISDVPIDIYDVAILSIPNDQKYSCIKQLISAGKHILVDKPLSFTPAQFNEISHLAESKRCYISTSYNHRFEPAIIKMKRQIDSGLLGTMYRARFLYGNGTVQNWIGTWRETPAGVVEDLGCHLLDLTLFLGISLNRDFMLFQASRFESKATEIGTFGSKDGVLIYECSNCTWKNRFEIDLYGSKGSLHLSGLKKWGVSTLEYHRRTLPSGPPEISSETFNGNDQSWSDEMNAFNLSLASALPNLERDIQIGKILDSIIQVLNN